MKKLDWPPRRTRLICSTPQTLAWYALDQLLPREATARMYIDELAHILHQKIWALDTDSTVSHADVVEEIRTKIATDPNFIVEGANYIGLRYRTSFYQPDAFHSDAADLLKVECKSSPVHGTGLFARIDMKKGEMLKIAYQGEIRYSWETKHWPDCDTCYNMRLPSFRFLEYCTKIRDTKNNPCMFVNEAPSKARANVEYHVPAELPWIVWLRITKPVARGQELLIDTYGPKYYY